MTLLTNHSPLFEIDRSALKGLHIVVLKGGNGAERAVSLVSGAAVANALRSHGHNVSEIDVTELDVTNRSLRLPETTGLVFNMIHGTFGEDGTVQAILEKKGIPFTGEGSQGSHLAFDKILAKRKFIEAGVSTIPFEILVAGQTPSFPLPFVLKPPRQGSAIGVQIVREESQIASAMKDCLQYGDEVLLETFFPGKELTVGIVADVPLPIVEIVPSGNFYSYQNKYTPGGSTYYTPARINPAATARVQQIALAAHRALDLQIYSRVDILYNEAGEVVVLEVNTLPGMTPTSLLPQAAAAMGLDFASLCEIIGVLSLHRDAKK